MTHQMSGIARILAACMVFCALGRLLMAMGRERLLEQFEFPKELRSRLDVRVMVTGKAGLPH